SERRLLCYDLNVSVWERQCKGITISISLKTRVDAVCCWRRKEVFLQPFLLVHFKT
ncbi:hypothetical protein CSUI_011306, partial [Cystoisospora suis]